MSVSLTRFCWWYWSSGKGKQPLGSDLMKRSSKKVKKKWQSREERKRVMDKEYDLVLVPSDGVCLSASDESSYDSDWSIGWMEPHGPDFLYQSDDDDDAAVADNSFAVLVPCYRNDCKGLKMEEQATANNQFMNVLTDFPNGIPNTKQYASYSPTRGVLAAKRQNSEGSCQKCTRNSGAVQIQEVIRLT